MSATTKAAPVAAKATTALAVRHVPVNGIDDLLRLASIFFKAGIVPKGVGSPEGAAAIIVLGGEAGLTPGQALQNISVVNGRATMWGDAMLALVRSSGKLAAIDERIEGSGDERAGVCKVTRQGEPERVFRFSVADARRAKLWDNPKKQPWIEYPDRMLQLRARGFALRDVFPDVLAGMVTREEAEDDGPVVTVSPPKAPPAEAPTAATPPAAASEPAALSAVASSTVESDLMSDAEQWAEIARLQEKFLSHAFLSTRSKPEQYKADWLKVLARWKVDSAKKLTHAQAEELLGLMRTDADKLVEEMRKFF